MYWIIFNVIPLPHLVFNNDVHQRPEPIIISFDETSGPVGNQDELDNLNLTQRYRSLIQEILDYTLENNISACFLEVSHTDQTSSQPNSRPVSRVNSPYHRASPECATIHHDYELGKIFFDKVIQVKVTEKGGTNKIPVSSISHNPLTRSNTFLDLQQHNPESEHYEESNSKTNKEGDQPPFMI